MPCRELFNVNTSDFPEDAFDGLPDGAVQTEEGDVPTPLAHALYGIPSGFRSEPM